MTLIHGPGYSMQDREAYREIIFSNVISSMRTILTAMTKLGIPIQGRHRQQARIVMQFGSKRHRPEEGRQAQGLSNGMPRDVYESIKTLWLSDEGVRKAFDRRREFQLNDSAG
jgi:guanine nucleotide-binding protein G(i) subunit alpha